MKAVLFLFVSLLSFNVSAAPIDVLTGQFSHPDLGGGGGCNATRCAGSISMPVTYKDLNDTGGPLPDTEYYFWSGNDLVDREMSMVFSAYVAESVSGMLTWDSGGLYNGGQLNVFGYAIDLSLAPSGTFYLSLIGNTLSSSYIEVDADSVDAFVSWRFVFDQPPPISEVPLPSGLFLFAPALLGLIGIRRRLT